MFFLLRCVFWLSIVYASILLPKSEWHRLTGQQGRENTAALASVTQTVVSGVTDACARRAALCLTEAARLTALIDATDTTGRHLIIAPATISEAGEAAIPVPVPRPRDVRGANDGRKP